MFIEPTITRVPSGFSGYIWLDTKIVLTKKEEKTSLTEKSVSSTTNLVPQSSPSTKFVHIIWPSPVQAEMQELLVFLAIFFFFRMLAQSYVPNIYTPTPIPLLYSSFTIVLHKGLRAYPFRAVHTPACLAIIRLMSTK